MRYSLIVCLLLSYLLFICSASATFSCTGISWDTAASGNTDPCSITMNSSYFWILDTTGTEVYKYYSNGTYTGVSWDTTISGNAAPYGITMNSSYFWVTDSYDDEVYKYYSNGTYTGVSWDTAASGNTGPHDITMNSSYFWIVDFLGDKVYQYHLNGTYSGTNWGTDSGVNTIPFGIDTDDSFFWISDILNNGGIFRYYLNGTYSGIHLDNILCGNTRPYGVVIDGSYIWVVDKTDNEVYQYYNNPNIPTIPIIITPPNESVYTSNSPILLNVTSTDADNDTITYYFYGGTSPTNMSFLGNNDTVNESAFNWSIYQNDGYYWTARAHDGYEYSDNMTTVQFTAVIQVNLFNPINNSTIYTTYPPLIYDVTFDWQDVGSPQYRLMVAEDVNFNVMAVDIHISTNSSIRPLAVNKQYWWKVYSYDGTTYSNSSEVYDFNLTGNSSLTGSAIEGVVYGDIDGTNTVLSGAEVNIWNTTWSDSTVTGSNGYYLFTGVVSGQVYNVQAKKDLYLDSSIALVTATANPVTHNFFLLPDRTSEEWRHYVRFVIWGVSGYYNNIEVKVYENSDITALYTATTGSDGSVTFILDRQQAYRVTFINASQGINREMNNLYPKEEEYLIFIASADPWTIYDEPIDDIVGIGVTTEIINSTHAYVNVSYTDTMTETTAATVDLNQSNSSDAYNQTVIDSQSGFTNNWTHGFIVSNYKGSSYYVNVLATHTTYGAIDQTYAVQFEDDIVIDGIPTKAWLYISLLVMMFTGAMFAGPSKEGGAMIVCIEAWAFLMFGWFASIDHDGIMTVCIAVATVVAIIANINKFNRKEGFE